MLKLAEWSISSHTPGHFVFFCICIQGSKAWRRWRERMDERRIAVIHCQEEGMVELHLIHKWNITWSCNYMLKLDYMKELHLYCNFILKELVFKESWKLEIFLWREGVTILARSASHIFCTNVFSKLEQKRCSWSPWLRWRAQKIAKTSQELQMLSSVTLNCQEAKTVRNSGPQLSE